MGYTSWDANTGDNVDDDDEDDVDDDDNDDEDNDDDDELEEADVGDEGDFTTSSFDSDFIFQWTGGDFVVFFS